jgi:hypothetical protein
MTKQTVTSLALAAGCALALTVPAAQAQTRVITNGPEMTPGDFSSSAHRNVAESAQYDRLLERSSAFRHTRMRKECGPIADPQLRQNCFASFAQYEPSMGSRDRTMARTRQWPQEQRMTGSSTGTMNSTTGTAGYSHEGYGAGYGSTMPMTNNYRTPTNNFGASRNLPGEYNTGMNQAPGAMPNYPGPRPSGPLSGGGGAGGGASGGSGGAGGGAGGM